MMRIKEVHIFSDLAITTQTQRKEARRIYELPSYSKVKTLKS